MRKNRLYLLLLLPLVALVFLGVSQTNRNEHMVNATLWFQRSSEYRALCYQAYNVARRNLEVLHLSHEQAAQKAVVLDLDETVLDNSPYQVVNILEDRNYPDGWKAWCEKVSALAIPGSVEFLKFTDQAGFQIFYVSNRKENVRESTMKNMGNLGLPQVTDDHVLLRTKSSSKVERRESIAKNFEIVLQVGDNLNDFSGDFEVSTYANRKAATEKSNPRFGNQFIVLPNPMYGEWERAVYDFDMDIPEGERGDRRRGALRRD